MMLNILIITPETELFKGTAEAAFLPGTLGEFEVLPGHAPIISSLTAGNIRLRLSGGEIRSIGILSGFMRCERDAITVCVEV